MTVNSGARIPLCGSRRPPSAWHRLSAQQDGLSLNIQTNKCTSLNVFDVGCQIVRSQTSVPEPGLVGCTNLLSKDKWWLNKDCSVFRTSPFRGITYNEFKNLGDWKSFERAWSKQLPNEDQEEEETWRHGYCGGWGGWAKGSMRKRSSESTIVPRLPPVDGGVCVPRGQQLQRRDGSKQGLCVPTGAQP